jgi:hypothetical protein
MALIVCANPHYFLVHRYCYHDAVDRASLDTSRTEQASAHMRKNVQPDKHGPSRDVQFDLAYSAEILCESDFVSVLNWQPGCTTLDKKSDLWRIALG